MTPEQIAAAYVRELARLLAIDPDADAAAGDVMLLMLLTDEAVYQQAADNLVVRELLKLIVGWKLRQPIGVQGK